MEPLVTVMIVTYNRIHELKRALESVNGQSYKNIEIIVVDNASQDGTADWIKKNHPDIRLLHLFSNIGCPSARNTGFAMSAGTYIYQLDDDGWLDHDAIKMVVELFESNESAAVVMSTVIEIEDGKKNPFYVSSSGEPEEIFLFNGGCSAIRRKAIGDVGGYPDDFFRQAEETALSLKVLDKDYKIFYQPSSIMYHKPSKVERHPELFMYYHLRNTIRIGYQLIPFPYWPGKVLLQLWYALLYSTREMAFSFFPKLLLQAVIDFPILLKRRHPVRVRTFKKMLKTQV
jgi:GT2 family glycosyltransferase